MPPGLFEVSSSHIKLSNYTGGRGESIEYCNLNTPPRHQASSLTKIAATVSYGVEYKE